MPRSEAHIFGSLAIVLVLNDMFGVEWFLRSFNIPF